MSAFKRHISLLGRFSLISFLLLSACHQNPTACIVDLPVVEVNREMTYHSCSEHAKFLTWDFGDGSYGVIADSSLHTYREEGNYQVSLTAYSKGAYNSDMVISPITAAYRYVEHVDVSGDINYNNLQLVFGNTKINRTGSLGTHAESHPYVIQIWPQDTLKIPMDKYDVALNGLVGSTPYFLLSHKFNFEVNTDNPVIISEGDLMLKLYWKFIY